MLVQERLVEEPREGRDPPENGQERQVELRACRKCRRELATGQKLPKLQVFRGFVVLGESPGHALQALAVKLSHGPTKGRRLDNCAEPFDVGGDVLADRMDLR